MSVVGLFVAFEGIDGCGKGTQIGEVEKTIKHWNKYQDIILTREPTWRAEELRNRLESEMNSMTNALRMAKLFIEDRKEHQLEITYDLEHRRVVLCDRYAMSTLAYQSTQELFVDDLVKTHFNANIRTPDITFYLALKPEEAARRMSLRGDSPEKFEDIEFSRKLAEQYEFLFKESKRNMDIRRLLGNVVRIDGEQEQKFVTASILGYLNSFYKSRLEENGNFCINIDE